MSDFPTLDHGNTAVVQLRDWLQAQRKAAQRVLEDERDHDVLLRTQGRAALLRELEQRCDPAHQQLMTRTLRRPAAGESTL